VPFLRNALSHAGKGQRQMVRAAINTVFAAAISSGDRNFALQRLGFMAKM